MLGRSGRSFIQTVFNPIVSLLVKTGISANTITLIGTLLTCTLSLSLVSTNHLIIGPLAVTLAALFDSLDGQIARRTDTGSQWGAFLDSTLDRVSDAAVFSSIILWGYFWADPVFQPWVISGGLAALIFGFTVSYARARAESIAKSAANGIAERTDRLIAVGVCALLVGFGLPHWILAVGLWGIAVISLITVLQRMYTVYRQCIE